jgi:MFS family permease
MPAVTLEPIRSVVEAVQPARWPARWQAWRLPTPAAFVLLASLLVSFLAASSAPTPLYSTYQAEWGFTPITTTVVFGIYALAVLAALLTFGKLSDHIGRRPVLITAALTQALAMIVFATADGVPMLMVARVIQGLATGAAAGAIGAGLIDLNPSRGTLANAVAAPAGTGLGSLLAGFFVQFLPAPTRLVYLVLLGLFVVQAAGVALMRETVTPRPGALASMKPEFSIPLAARRPLLVAAPALVAVWALAGLYGSLGPALIRGVTGSSALILGGLALFALAGAGSLTVLLTRSATPRAMAIYGTVALIVGVAVTLASISGGGSTFGFFAGSVIAGSGFGGGFQGAIRTVLPTAEAHERAGLLSVLYSISYTAMGLPAVIAGYLVVNDGGLLHVAHEYGVTVMVLAALALIGLLRQMVRRPATAG